MGRSGQRPAGPADTTDTTDTSDTSGITAPGGAPRWHYRPRGADRAAAAIEGTVSEEGARTRLGGAVINVADRAGALIASAVTDDTGRYRVDGVAPGVYVVSANYTLVGRGQFEIRRTDVDVAAGEVVVVPLELETDD
jgi:hypothetical protein